MIVSAVSRRLCETRSPQNRKLSFAHYVGGVTITRKMSRNVASKKRKTTPPLGTDDAAIPDAGGADDASQAKRIRPLASGLPSGPNDKQFFESKLGEIEEELKLIKSLEHPELQEKVQALEKKKKDDLQKATLMKELGIREVEALYEFAIQEASDVFNNRKKEVQERMQLDAEESIRRLKEMRDGLVKKKTSGRGRSGSIDDDASQEEEEAAAQGPEEPEESQAPGIKRSLRSQGADRKAKDWEQTKASILPAPADAISTDLAKMHADWIKRVEAYHSKEQVVDMAIRVEDGRLYYNETIIEKGANVVVHSEPTNDPFYGTAIKITPSEVTIRLADGGSARLLIANLKSGRCKIAKDLTKDVTAVATQ
jgi:hypothetical protein